jgi:hypothetical protein
MSIAKKEIEKHMVDHEAGKQRQDEINQFQQKYGFINKRVQDELELTDGEAYGIMALHCGESHCEHHGGKHWYALPDTGCLLFKCNNHMVFLKTWPIKLLRGKKE